MKKVVSLILVVLTIITVMFVGSVSASAGGSGGITRTRAETEHTSYAHANKHDPTIITTELPWQKGSTELGSTVNEINPATYIIVATGILVVVLVSVMLIGYNVKKKKKPAVADGTETDEE